jgi:hypothetical protein
MNAITICRGGRAPPAQNMPTRFTQDLIGAAQFLHLALEQLQALSVITESAAIINANIFMAEPLGQGTNCHYGCDNRISSVCQSLNLRGGTVIAVVFPSPQ